MMQQINLYQPERYAGPRLAAANTGIGVVVLGVVLVAAYYALGAWQLQRTQQAYSQAQAQNRDYAAQRDGLRARVNQAQPSVALESEVDRLERDREAKRSVSNLLDGDAAGNRAGFSSHLEGLARRPLQGLWLTGISIDKGGRQMALRGYTLSADLLPHYLERLRDEPAFSGVEFRTVEMNRSTEDARRIEFHLDTRAAEGKARD